MPTDGLTRYDKLNGAELVVIAHRGPVSTPQLEELEIERYDALPYQERRQFLAAIAGDIVGEIARRSLGANYASVRANVMLSILFLLSVASYWAFLRWMLRERVSDMEVVIVRRKSGDPSNT